MALRPLIPKQNAPYYCPNLSCHLKPSFQPKEMPQKFLQCNISRRTGAIAAMASILLAREAIFSQEIANGLDLRMVAPDYTIEQAESLIKGHVQSMLDVKGLLESESWSEARRELRQSASNLKIDFYTIIQNKPGNERPQLRKLYSNLFNNVTKLDHAARDKDVALVKQCYENIVMALSDMLSKI